MKREKPDEASTYEFEEFEKFADSHAISTDKCDWELWWECWKDGYICGYEA